MFQARNLSGGKKMINHKKSNNYWIKQNKGLWVISKDYWREELIFVLYRLYREEEDEI